MIIPGGPGVLALLREWPQLGGFSAYVPRGPVPAATPAESARRVLEVADLLEAEAIDVLAVDAEVPTDPAYSSALVAKSVWNSTTMLTR